MNLILFNADEIVTSLPRADPRARHVLEVLRRKVGDTFDAGVINGPRGKSTLTAIGTDALTLTFTWGPPPPPLDPITLVIGMPRPQTARDILRDVTTLGVAALHFVATEKSEPSYAHSTLWSSGEWRRHALAGAQQAFDTRVPEITFGRALGDVLASLASHSTRLALDNYEASAALSACHATSNIPLVLAIGPERGWTAQDRTTLRDRGFTLAHLGSRVLRTEPACIAAVTLARSKLGLLSA